MYHSNVVQLGSNHVPGKDTRSLKNLIGCEDDAVKTTEAALHT